jgi:LysR family glycine cleavage system transcriptional activator
VEDTIRGPNWALLTHRDSENNPLARSFVEWLLSKLGAASQTQRS